MDLAAGTRLGRYEVLSPLGAGGMGEVYLALDTQLERKIALKLLPARLTQDEDRLRRFVQEAKAASALNHPNIITIHEIGQIAGAHFIATEFIEGQTLRQQVTRGRMKLRDALDVAAQVASALVAAHAAGIVHRDIKPENVMVRPDGLVKVLDFGLAKLTERRASAADSDAPTRAKVETDPGTIMGTAQYMSPEQARGQEVDARTDIFSLGIVLYEMIAGRAPFDGATVSHIIISILEQEPPPLARYAPEVPAEMERIVTKALAKDCEERYQTVKDVLIDLKRLKQRLELEAELKRSQQREGSEGAAGETSAEPAIVETARQPAVSTADAGAARTTSSAKIILSEIKRHKRGVVLALAALLVIVAGAGFGIYKLLDRKSATPAQALKITRLTSTGKASNAAISPDGKYVVYAQSEEGQQSLWMAQVAVSSNVQIAPPANVNYRGITFSRDGNFIYYVRNDADNRSGALYQMPVLGGNARKLLANIQSAVTLSPDGKRLAFVRTDRSQNEAALMVANADGTGERKLTTRKFHNNFVGLGPAWSPDGKVIAFGQENVVGALYRSVVGVWVADGREQPITSQRWEGNALEGIAWLSDGSGVLVTASEQAGALSQVWLLAWPGDEARRVTNDLNGYGDLSLTADSGTLAAVRSERVVNLWVAPDGDASRARQITSGTERQDGTRGLAWTPDGKILYYSEAGGNQNIWVMEADGTGKKQLSPNARRNRDAAVSPDGRYVVWQSNRTGNNNIWRMDRDGGALKQLTNGVADYFPQISPDGKWVVYMGRSKEGRRLWKVAIDGGDPVQLTDKPSGPPIISPDGKMIAFIYLDEASGQGKMAVMPFEGGAPTNVFDLQTGSSPFIRWTPDGRALAYVRDRNAVSNIWAQPLDGGPPKQLTDFKDQRIFNFAWSRDGKQLALSRGVVNSDVVLISNFR